MADENEVVLNDISENESEGGNIGEKVSDEALQNVIRQIESRLVGFESGDSKPTVIRCPICNRYLHLGKERRREGWNEAYDNWVFSCPHCGMFHYELAADGYYGREYFSIAYGAIEELIKKLREVKRPDPTPE